MQKQNLKSRFDKISGKHVEMNERLLMKLFEMYYKNPRFKSNDGKLDVLCRSINNANQCCENVKFKGFRMRPPSVVISRSGTRGPSISASTKALNQSLKELVDMQEENIQEYAEQIAKSPQSLRKKVLERTMKSNLEEQRVLLQQLINQSGDRGQAEQEIFTEIDQQRLNQSVEQTPPKGSRAPTPGSPRPQTPASPRVPTPGSAKAPSPGQNTFDIPSIITTPPQSPTKEIKSPSHFLKPTAPGEMATSTPFKPPPRMNIDKTYVVTKLRDKTFNVSIDRYFPMTDFRRAIAHMERIIKMAGEPNKSINITSMAVNIAPGKYNIYKMK